MKIRLEWKPQDLWIGMYWETKTDVVLVPQSVLTTGGQTKTFQVPRGCAMLHIWICLLPMIPIHIIKPRPKFL